jgi:protein-disulfide isomerase
MNKVTITIIAVLVILFGGLAVWAISSRERAEYDVNDIIAAMNQNGNIGDHVRGNPDAEIVIIEYGDFGCSHCAQMQVIVDRLAEDYGDRIAFVFRHFLLGGAYKNSMAAAAAAEAAGKQGLFNEMADKIYENQAVWFYIDAADRNDTFSNMFTSIGGENIEQFLTDMNSPEIKKKINFDDSLGRKQGVQGTPTFFYNGNKIANDDMKDENAFRAFLDRILAEKGLPTGSRQTEETDGSGTTEE